MLMIFIIIFFLSHQKLRLSTNKLFSSVFFFCGTDLFIGEFIHWDQSLKDLYKFSGVCHPMFANTWFLEWRKVRQTKCWMTTKTHDQFLFFSEGQSPKIARMGYTWGKKWGALEEFGRDGWWRNAVYNSLFLCVISCVINSSI